MDIIAFTGVAGSGKSTAAQFLVKQHSFKLIKFAEPLKSMLHQFYRSAGVVHENLIEEKIEGRLKEAPCHYLNNNTPRFAMQTLGTEWGRNIMGRSFWTNAWTTAVVNSNMASIVCDDCRFENEAEALRQMGGKIVQIVREGAGLEDSHESEQIKIDPDLVIHNNGTLDDLYKEVDQCLQFLGMS